MVRFVVAPPSILGTPPPPVIHRDRLAKITIGAAGCATEHLIN